MTPELGWVHRCTRNACTGASTEESERNEQQYSKPHINWNRKILLWDLLLSSFLTSPCHKKTYNHLCMAFSIHCPPCKYLYKPQLLRSNNVL